MAEYEVVREILNSCANNQMRDVFFEEVETENPVAYVKRLLKADEPQELSVEEHSDGSLTVYANCNGLNQKFLFTEI